MTNPYQSIVYKNKTTHHHEIKKSKILSRTFDCSDNSSQSNSNKNHVQNFTTSVNNDNNSYIQLQTQSWNIFNKKY